jgi:hypothetical protein
MVQAPTVSHGASAQVPHPRTGIRNGGLRAVVLTACAGAAVALAIPAVGPLLSVRGVPGPTVMDAVEPGRAALAVALALAGFTVLACVAGRLINAAVGLFVLGCGCAFLTMRSGSVLDAGFDGDALRRIALETLAWAGVVGALSAVVFKVSGPLPDIPPRDHGAPFWREALNAEAFRGLLAGLVGLGAVWLLARNDLKGQAVGSAVVAGVATALAARRLLGRAQPILLVAAPVAFVGLAQLWTSFGRTEPLDLLVATNALPGWSRLMPLDAAAGALLGVPIGLGWSRANAEEER